MARKEYNKLVRDKIPEIIREHGENPVTHTANDKEYWLALLAKVQEEVQELISSDGSVEEIADLLEVVEAIIEHRNIDRTTLTKLQAKKKRERGGFDQKIILEATE